MIVCCNGLSRALSDVMFWMKIEFLIVELHGTSIAFGATLLELLKSFLVTHRNLPKLLKYKAVPQCHTELGVGSRSIVWIMTTCSYWSSLECWVLNTLLKVVSLLFIDQFGSLFFMRDPTVIPMTLVGPKTALRVKMCVRSGDIQIDRQFYICIILLDHQLNPVNGSSKHMIQSRGYLGRRKFIGGFYDGTRSICISEMNTRKWSWCW